MHCFGQCRVTDHEHTNRQDHCTVSTKGVTRMRADDETEFVPLDRWEQEYSYFRKLVQVGPTYYDLRNYCEKFTHCCSSTLLNEKMTMFLLSFIRSRCSISFVCGKLFMYGRRMYVEGNLLTTKSN